MKAVVIRQFGGPEKLNLEEIPTPNPKANEIRIKVAYTAVNPVDWKIREGYLEEMFPHHFPLILGWDVAGVVDAVGNENGSKFRIGDQVYAYARKSEVQWGTYAEYVVLEESAVAKIPSLLSLEQAATIPLAGLTAWQGLHRFGGHLEGKSVLIHGAAGGVGSFAVQFAKVMGADVVATASTKNHKYLEDLGADILLDYQTSDIAGEMRERFPTGVDFIFDTIGSETLEKSYALLAKGGALVSIADEPDEERAKKNGAQSAFVFVSPSDTELEQIAKLMDGKQVSIPEYQVMPLLEVREAHKLSQSGHVRGKILLKP